MNQYLAFGLILLALVGWSVFEHNRFLTIKSEYSEFKESSLANALKQEKAHHEQVSNALSDRDNALKRLRDQVRSKPMPISFTPEGVDRVCFNGSEFDGAYRILVSEIRAVSGKGQESLIDNKTWADSWPK